MGAKKSDSTALTVTTQKNAIKNTFDKRFAIPLDFDFSRHPVYPYGLKEELILRLELNSSENVILCTGDTSATYKLSDISLEYDAIFDEPYATTIGEMYTGTTSIPYITVKLIHYQTLSKKGTTWKIDVNNFSVRSLQGLLLLFLDKRDDFANKNEEFYNPSIHKILVTINGMPHQLFASGLQAKKIYPELKKYFYKIFWRQNLHYGWIHVQELTKLFTAAAGQLKKVVYYFRSKKHLKPVVTLHATHLALKMQ